MTAQIEQPRNRVLLWAAISFAIGFAVHGLDHVRRGMSASPMFIMIGEPTVWPGYQDSFISLPHTNVNWFSWFSAIAEIGTALVFAAAGIQAVRTQSSDRDTTLAQLQVRTPGSAVP